MTPRWHGYEHEQLDAMIKAGPGAHASDGQTQYWTSLTGELKDIDDELNKALSQLKATWDGTASDSANTGMTPLQQWAGDAQTGSSVMRISSVDQAEYISTARAHMPEPVQVTTPAPSTWDKITAGASLLTGDAGPAAAVAAQSADHEAQEAAKEKAAQKAVDTMVTYENSSTWNRNTLGTFVPPPDVVVATPPPAGESSVGGAIGSAAGFGALPDTREGSAQSAINTPGGGGSGGQYNPPPPPPGDGGSGAPGSGGAGGALPGGNNSGTDPSSGVPLPPSPPISYPTPPPPPPAPGPGPGWGPPGPLPLPVGQLAGDPNGGTSNLSNRPGGPSGLRGGPGGLPGGVPGGIDEAGRSAAQLGRGGVTGMGGMPGEGVLGRGGPGVGAAGARGGPGMGGGPMGAGRGEGDDDDEHFSPDYLLETTDVFGDARMVSPAVIGEDPNSEEK